MTDEQLFKIIKKHLPENLAYRQNGGLLNPCKIEGTLGDVLDFVKAIYEDGYNMGYDDGDDDGYNRGTIDGKNDGINMVRSGILGD